MTDASGQTNPALPWRDLATNQPGQAGRERAAALYSQWRQASLFRRLATNRSEEQATRRTVAGQIYVARQFARLGPTWHVLHTIPETASGDPIDHLLIGPGGVFAVNSRHQAKQTVWLGGDTLMVNGGRVHHLRDSRIQADRASELLTAVVGFNVPVIGLIVIVGDKRFDVRCQPDDSGVRVTTPRPAVRWLRHRPTEWTDYGVTRIFEAARRSTTWAEAQSAPVSQPSQPPSVDAGEPDHRETRAAS